MSVIQMVPSSSLHAKAAKVIEAVGETVDRRQAEKALANAIRRQAESAEEHADAVKAAQEALDNCEYERLRRALVLAKEHKLSAASYHETEIKTLTDRLFDDAKASKASRALYESLKRSAEREQEQWRLADHAGMSPSKFVKAEARHAELKNFLQGLPACLVAADPVKALQNLATQYEVDN